MSISRNSTICLAIRAKRCQKRSELLLTDKNKRRDLQMRLRKKLMKSQLRKSQPKKPRNLIICSMEDRRKQNPSSPMIRIFNKYFRSYTEEPKKSRSSDLGKVFSTRPRIVQAVWAQNQSSVGRNLSRLPTLMLRLTIRNPSHLFKKTSRLRKWNLRPRKKVKIKYRTRKLNKQQMLHRKCLRLRHHQKRNKPLRKPNLNSRKSLPRKRSQK